MFFFFDLLVLTFLFFVVENIIYGMEELRLLHLLTTPFWISIHGRLRNLRMSIRRYWAFDQLMEIKGVFAAMAHAF